MDPVIYELNTAAWLHDIGTLADIPQPADDVVGRK